MKYTIQEKVFKLNPEIKFGILIGKNMEVTKTTFEDGKRLRNAEEELRENVVPDNIRELRNISLYRDVMKEAGINPNKYPASIEAMFKRILKGNDLPLINSLVDLCNAVSIENILSLGGHDLDDIEDDLEVRFSKEGDKFLPFSSKEFEEVEEGELVFTSGDKIQTRKWVWRQSELGKITQDSSNIFFQLVGFGNDPSLKKAMNDIEDLIINRFNGTCEKFLVDINNNSIEFYK
ncbi:MAG: phenylalanine--tRNA ligase beta subunit-related protein [Bacillota bacterium]|nr:phenylalanine--tRNA ligase beta subunit-related protein [Bacillota bacterium]